MTAVLFRRRRLGLGSCRGIEEHSETGITYARADQPNRWPEDTDLVIRWGCTANIPVECNNVLNTAEAIHRVSDKTGFRQLLMHHHVNEDGPLLCPMTYFEPGFATDFDDVQVIVRPGTHAQGRHLYVCNSAEEADRYMRRLPNAYASELINKSAEYRVFVAQGRAVWVARKTPGNPDDVAWNVARGGRFDNVRWGDWPLRVVRVAVEAFNLSGLDFGGVDIIVDQEGRCYCVEINSAPSQTSPYRQSCVARVFDYIVRNGKGAIPLVEERGDWKKWAHPALSGRVLVP